MSNTLQAVNPSTVVGLKFFSKNLDAEGSAFYQKEIIVAIEDKAISKAIRNGTGIQGVNSELNKMIDEAGSFPALYHSFLNETKLVKATFLIECLTKNSNDLNQINSLTDKIECSAKRLNQLSSDNFETSPHRLRMSDKEANKIYDAMSADIKKIYTIMDSMSYSGNFAFIKSVENMFEKDTHIHYAASLFDIKKENQRSF